MFWLISSHSLSKKIEYKWINKVKTIFVFENSILSTVLYIYIYIYIYIFTYLFKFLLEYSWFNFYWSVRFWCTAKWISHVCVLSRFSRVLLFETLWTVSHQAPLFMGFSRHEYWTGLTCPSPGDLPDPGVEPASFMSCALAGKFFTTRATWEASIYIYIYFIYIYIYFIYIYISPLFFLNASPIEAITEYWVEFPVL